MFALLRLCVSIYFVRVASSSTLTTPPQSAVVVAFEDAYDLSLLANTLSDQGIDATLIIPSSDEGKIYENLIDVEVLKLEVDVDKSAYPESRTIQACENLLTDDEIARKIREIQPTFIIFPAFRHDGCLIPWTKSIESIPVIWTRNRDEEAYVFEYTGAALPVQNVGFWSRLSASFSRRSIISHAKDEYVTYALRIAAKHIPEMSINVDNLYSDIRLILWGADTVLRADFASLTQSVVEIGCHHCRGPQHLQGELQKSLVQYRLGTIVVLLDQDYETLVRELAEKLPQGREGQAVVWKNKDWKNSESPLPENLFINTKIDRQDLVGYGRTRVLLSHCSDTELLEAAFHGTPVICFPRNAYELKNAARARELGFAIAEDLREMNSEEIGNAVTQIHESPDYRENARRVSLGIRDRINPASDRLIYWLRYMARTKDQIIDFHAPRKTARTFNEDLQFFLGLFVGAAVCVFLRYVALLRRTQRSKGRYTR